METIRVPDCRLYLDESGDHCYDNLDEVSHRYLAILGCIFQRDKDYEEMSKKMATIKQKYWPHQDPDKPIIFQEKKPLEMMKRGPATGAFLYVANQDGHHAVGCDISSRFIEYAKEKYHVHIDQGRFEHQAYGSGAFDAIFLFAVLENIPNPAELFQAVHRTLKPDGLLVLNFVDMERNLIAAIQKENYFLYRPPICYIYTMSVLERTLKKFGFKVIEAPWDIRFLHVEKMMTLLGWKWPLKLFRLLRLQHVPFPVYAYPSRIVIARKQNPVGFVNRPR